MSIKDPTRNEMREFINTQFGNEPDEFDIEEAIYWFAYCWHGGQWSDLYSVLSTSPFHPSPLANGPEPDGFAAIILDALETEYATR